MGRIRILGVSSSPRAGSNTAILVNEALRGALTIEGVETKFIALRGKRINFCVDCDQCPVERTYCAQKDDMQEIYSAFIGADVVVFATPMYWGYMTAQLKAVMDRMEAITGYFKGKTFVVLITYRHHCESTVAFYKRICPYFGVDLHVITCRTMDEQENDIPITSLPEKLQEAYALGESLRTLNMNS